MSDVDLLIQEKDNATSVPYMRFILLVGKLGTNAFYYFIEGYDAPYYQDRIKQSCTLEPIPIKCHGKKKILDVYSLVNITLHDRYKKAFFIDKDFDDNVNISNDICITPCYSIENLYTSEHVLSEILKCEFDILPSDKAYNEIIELFLKEKNEFHVAISEFNVWYACIKNQGSGVSVNLEDSIPRGFINMQIGSIVKRYDIIEIKKRFPIDTDVCSIELALKSAELNANPSLLYRGKYEMQFFCQFLAFLIEDANLKNKRKYIKSKTKFQINRALILSHLSQYADTPPCLTAYLERRVA